MKVHLFWMQVIMHEKGMLHIKSVFVVMHQICIREKNFPSWEKQTSKKFLPQPKHFLFFYFIYIGIDFYSKIMLMCTYCFSIVLTYTHICKIYASLADSILLLHVIFFKEKKNSSHTDLGFNTFKSQRSLYELTF